MSVSFAPALADDIKEAADRESTTISAWLADAARAKLRNEGLMDAIRDWEAHFGPLTEEELERADRIFQQADAIGAEGGVLVVGINLDEEEEGG